jgi:CDP-paratose 2-epimerase
MKVLITGGCGFLGSNVASSFLQEGHQVVLVDGLYRTGSTSNLAWLKTFCQSESQLLHYELDIANNEALENIFQSHPEIEYICHLCGQVAMTTSLSDPRRDFMTNAWGTLNILEAMRKFCPDACLAYSSTNKVYGDLEHLDYIEQDKRFSLKEFPNGLDESLPLDFASPYGCSKGAADQYVRDWHRNYGLKTIVFRHSSIYGGRQFSTYDQGWIGWFCSQGLKQRKANMQGKPIEPFTISGTGKQVRDVLVASDIVRLYRTAFDCRDTMAGQVYNIGGGIENSLSLLELFDMIQQLLGFEPNDRLVYNKIARRQSDQDFFVADTNKVCQHTGWAPSVSSRDGIKSMLEWLKSVDA